MENITREKILEKIRIKEEDEKIKKYFEEYRGKENFEKNRDLDERNYKVKRFLFSIGKVLLVVFVIIYFHFYSSILTFFENSIL